MAKIIEDKINDIMLHSDKIKEDKKEGIKNYFKGNLVVETKKNSKLIFRSALNKKSANYQLDRFLGLLGNHANVTFMSMPGAIEDFKEALFNAKDTDTLIDSLGKILWKFSHSSTYTRGQAAISLMLLENLANVIGYKLDFSPNWKPPANLNYDMQALSVLNLEDFLPIFRENIILIKF